MRVFVAGGAGVLGRRLVPQLVARGHQVTATTTSAAKLGLVEQLGADGVVMDGLDEAAVHEAVAAARPDVIAHRRCERHRPGRGAEGEGGVQHRR
ncbi:NAD-dependent epimerase/dehydratase family protein [Streptomyces sp.]|uniref:NAD-dependent epimerase/dehydratase family protein n=1 Tax=Streptomyces sp. TaxID=1931 RepID=UPI0039C999CD